VSEAERSAGRATRGAAEPFCGFSVVAAIVSVGVWKRGEAMSIDRQSCVCACQSH
jgi:hydrogenase/urease accessory protein HupE